jgi:hypothetical protein
VPFQENAVVQNLEEASNSKLRLRAFYRTYLPFPGCVLEGLEFNHGSISSKPLITIEKLIIRGSYFRIFPALEPHYRRKYAHIHPPIR